MFNQATISFMRSLKEVDAAYYKLLEKVREENPFIDSLEIEYINEMEEDLDVNELWERINDTYILVHNGYDKVRIQVCYENS